MIDFSIPLAGLNQAETKLNQTASRISKVGLTPEGDSVDLSAEMVSLIEARNAFAANTKVIKTEDQVTQNLFNLLG